MLAVTKKLFELQDKSYGDFQSGLVPGIPRESIIGIRLPVLRKLAKQLSKDDKDQIDEFLNTLPHQYYDENMLHGILLSEIKDYEECIDRVEAFLPYVDNWAVCDTMSPKVFGKYRPDLIKKIEGWVQSNHTYTCRFGMGMLMRHFLDEDYKKEYLNIPAAVQSEEYYVNMMIAWFFATALAKQWDDAVVYLQENRFSPWVHNKTIQKARESYRITKEQKEYLKTLKKNTK